MDFIKFTYLSHPREINTILFKLNIFINWVKYIKCLSIQTNRFMSFFKLKTPIYYFLITYIIFIELYVTK